MARLYFLQQDVTLAPYLWHLNLVNFHAEEAFENPGLFHALGRFERGQPCLDWFSAPVWEACWLFSAWSMLQRGDEQETDQRTRALPSLNQASLVWIHYFVEINPQNGRHSIFECERMVHFMTKRMWFWVIHSG